MSIISGTAKSAGGGYQIERSLRFRFSAPAYLSRTVDATATDSTKFTISFWVKRGSVGTGAAQWLLDSGTYTARNVIGGFSATDTFVFAQDTTANGRTTTAVFRDPTAWYHFVIAVDTGQGTESNRCKIYCKFTVLQFAQLH